MRPRPAKRFAGSIWHPFPPYSSSEDQLLLQLSGSQRISLVDATLLDSVPSFPDLDLGGHQPYISEQILLLRIVDRVFNETTHTVHEFNPLTDLDEKSLFESDHEV